MACRSEGRKQRVRAAAWALAVAAVAAFSIISSGVQADQAAARAEARDSGERGPYLVDGTFEGRAQSYGGPMDVSVTVENGYITAITVDKTYDDSPYIDDVMAAKIPEIVDVQDYDLDVVTNASYSSHGLMYAVKNALVKGGAVEGESATAGGVKKSSSTSELKALAQSAAGDESPWYEATLADVFGLSGDEGQPQRTTRSSTTYTHK